LQVASVHQIAQNNHYCGKYLYEDEHKLKVRILEVKIFHCKQINDKCKVDKPSYRYAEYLNQENKYP